MYILTLLYNGQHKQKLLAQHFFMNCIKNCKDLNLVFDGSVLELTPFTDILSLLLVWCSPYKQCNCTRWIDQTSYKVCV